MTHSAEKGLPRKVTFHGGSAERRIARKVRWCTARDAYPYSCVGRIEPGEPYVRSVMFPNHDASCYDRPVVRDTCMDCAMNYLYLMDLAVVVRRARVIPGPTTPPPPP